MIAQYTFAYTDGSPIRRLFGSPLGDAAEGKDAAMLRAQAHADAACETVRGYRLTPGGGLVYSFQRRPTKGAW